MSVQKTFVQRNRYADSVTLMGIADRVKRSCGVELVEVQMGTPANLKVLRGLGFEFSDGTGSGDLIVAIEAKDEAALETAYGQVVDRLDHKGTVQEDGSSFSTLEEAGSEGADCDLCQISLPGEYAAAEAEKAINMGLDVFIFSDNVSLEEELHLKRLGEEKDVLVMGPDCGVGLLSGVALATGSIVGSGPVGIVAASGSGAQEVACLVEKAGSGVSSLIGTGGRDLYPQIGGISMLKGMKRLAADPATEVIVLVSKIADRAVMENVLDAADKIEDKPVIGVFLGSDEELFAAHRVIPAFSLEAAAIRAVKAATGRETDFGYDAAEIDEIVRSETAKYAEGQKYLRGIYCGGTFAEESLIHFHKSCPDAGLFCNLNTPYAKRLADPRKSVGHALVDMGSEDFTRESPHPVFDLEQRLKRLRQEVEDPEVAVVLLDFITGPGVNEDPITPFTEACAEALARRKGALTIIAAICGSENDPQDVGTRERELREAGVVVTASNYQSARLASAFLQALS